MVQQIFAMLTQVLTSCVTWFEMIFNNSGMAGLFLAVVFFLILKRFLLDPLFRCAGSDQVKKRKE